MTTPDEYVVTYGCETTFADGSECADGSDVLYIITPAFGAGERYEMGLCEMCANELRNAEHIDSVEPKPYDWTADPYDFKAGSR